jgi:kinetochore protein Spc25
MRFTLIDPADPDREFSLIIDVSNHEYSGEFACAATVDSGLTSTVPNCSPPITALPDMLRQLNDDRDLYGFIKRGKHVAARPSRCHADARP